MSREKPESLALPSSLDGISFLEKSEKFIRTVSLLVSLALVSPLSTSSPEKTYFPLIDEVRNIILKKALTPPSVEELFQACQEAVMNITSPQKTEALCIESMLRKVGPYSLYFSPEEKEQVQEIVTAPPNIEFRVLPNKIGYLKIPSFREKGVAMEIEKILRQNTEIQGYILDLRGNMGGYLEEAENTMDFFLPNGSTTMIFQERERGKTSYYAESDLKITTPPLVVLIDKDTASASEILAGTLQEYERAIILGQNSYGKGSLERFISLSNKGSLTVTTGKFLPPSGKSIETTGISPDIQIQADADSLKRAITILSTKIPY